MLQVLYFFHMKNTVHVAGLCFSCCRFVKETCNMSKNTITGCCRFVKKNFHFTKIIFPGFCPAKNFSGSTLRQTLLLPQKNTKFRKYPSPFLKEKNILETCNIPVLSLIFDVEPTGVKNGNEDKQTLQTRTQQMKLLLAIFISIIVAIYLSSLDLVLQKLLAKFVA